MTWLLSISFLVLKKLNFSVNSYNNNKIQIIEPKMDEVNETPKKKEETSFLW